MMVFRDTTFLAAGPASELLRWDASKATTDKRSKSSTIGPLVRDIQSWFGGILMATDKQVTEILAPLPSSARIKDPTIPQEAGRFVYYCSAEFTRRLLEHMHRAKRRAIAESEG